MSAALRDCVAHAIALVSAAVERANARRGRAFDPVRGFYVTEREVEEIMADALRADVPPVPSAAIEGLKCLSLDDLETHVVALCAAAEVVPRFDRVIGFLHDDLTQRTLTTGLALELLCSTMDERARLLGRLEPSERLQRLALIEATADDAPLRSRLALDRGMLAWLRGRDAIDWRVADVTSLLAAPPMFDADLLEINMVRGVPLTLWGAQEDDLVYAAMAVAGARTMPIIDVVAGASPEQIRIAAREAMLSEALLLVRTDNPPAATAAARILDGLAVMCTVVAPSGVSGRSRGSHARVTPRQQARNNPIPAAPLPYGRRIAPLRTLDHLVLPEQRLRAVRSVLHRVRTRDTVQGTWKMRTGSSRGGVRALFSGPPGTGKTLCAEAVSGELGRDLYVVDLSMVVSKYIGETEKALATIFTEAARTGVCLFFDEADALFVKRTSVRDSHDRYANIETAFLLQAIDDYPDVVVMATNILSNVDQAMLRRIDVLIEFPMPDVPARRRLWQIALAAAPLDGVDLGALAERFALSGGAIQNAALSAAYEAAAESRAIGPLDVLRAARDEMAKCGKVAGRLELGDHYDLLMGDS